MGKLLVKVGLWISKTWGRFICFYNKCILKLIIKTGNCPNKTCNCKNKK